MIPEKCPGCGSVIQNGYTAIFECGSFIDTDGTWIESSIGDCIEIQRDRLKAEVERLRNEVGAAFSEGYSARIFRDLEVAEDEVWEESRAKRVSEGGE